MQWTLVWEAVDELGVLRKKINIVHGNIVTASRGFSEPHIDQVGSVEPDKISSVLRVFTKLSIPEFINLIDHKNVVFYVLIVEKLVDVRSKLYQLFKSVSEWNKNA